MLGRHPIGRYATPMPTTFLEAPEARVRAGAARADVTPPVGIYHRMWGAARHDVATGVHKPLLATALYLAPPDASSLGRVFIALDHCLLWFPEMQELLTAIASGAGLPRERVTVFFSHTHASGLMGRERTHLPGGHLILPYLAQLGETLGQLARQAQDAAIPATLTVGRGRCDLAANRDFFDSDGKAVCGLHPGGPVDDTVLVSRVRGDDGTPIASIINYACHPTTLAYENTLISPDFVGAMRELIEPHTGPCLFVQGASGDVGPRHGFVGDPAIADQNGRQLGYAVLAAWEALPEPGQRFQYTGPVISGATLGRWDYVPQPSDHQEQTQIWRERSLTVPMAYRPDLIRGDVHRLEYERQLAEEQAALARGDTLAARDARALAERATRNRIRTEHLPPGEAYPYQATLIRTGNILWLPLEGEHYNSLQRTLREQFPDFALIVGTVANGSHVWYLPDAEAFGKGLYQEEASIVVQGSLEQLRDALITAISELVTP